MTGAYPVSLAGAGVSFKIFLDGPKIFTHIHYHSLLQSLLGSACDDSKIQFVLINCTLISGQSLNAKDWSISESLWQLKKMCENGSVIKVSTLLVQGYNKADLNILFALKGQCHGIWYYFKIPKMD